MCDSFCNKIIKNERLSLTDLWKLNLFHYQYQYERKQLWFKNYEIHLIQLINYFKLIEQFAKNLPDGFKFQIKSRYKLLPINGYIHATNDETNEIIQFKFSKSDPSSVELLQLIGNLDALTNRDMYNYKIKIVNLMSMNTYTITHSLTDEKRYTYQYILSKAIDTEFQNACWIYDLETTSTIDHGKIPPIMEMYLEELDTGIVPINTLVQIGNYDYYETVIYCLNGLTRDQCNREGISILDLKIKLIDLLQQSSYKVPHNCCILAHNGKLFDHIILKELLQNDFNKILKKDSRWLISLFQDDKSENAKLDRLYTDVMGYEFQGQHHRAGDDVQMLIHILTKMDFTSFKICKMLE
jgi:inhibitor of KinA sporulation pathway (predicted exonuclease)